MNRIAIAGCIGVLLAAAAFLAAQDTAEKNAPPQEMKMPAPVREHEWLRQFVGEWDAEVEIPTGPGQPPLKSRATETVRSIGGFWVMGENKGVVLDKPFTGILTLGYDPEKKHYTGTWIDSMTSYLWTYEGSVDAAGKVLTLKTEGPCPHAPGRTSKFREVTEFKSKDHKIFTSSIQGEDGQWSTVMTVNYRRKQ